MAGPRYRNLVALLIVFSLLTGCLAGDDRADEEDGALDLPATAVDESMEPVPITVRAFTRAGGPIDVTGVTWAAPNATSAVLLIHGSGGGMSQFGSIGVPGYSLAHVLVDSGRTAVAIALPGYGETPGHGDLVGIEDYAYVIHQVAAALRSGSYHVDDGEPGNYGTVIGAGISMGGLLVDVTQGMFGSFEGIVPMAWSHGRFSEEADRCFSFTTLDCPEHRTAWTFRTDNADPAVVDAVLNASDWQPFPAGAGNGIALWSACTGCWAYETRPVDDAMAGAARPDDVTALIEVPVLSILGDDDWYWVEEDYAQQESHYPRATTFELLLLEDTNHMVFHHLNRFQVHDAMVRWMSEHGL